MNDFINALKRASRAYMLIEGNGITVTSGDLLTSETVVFPDYQSICVTDGKTEIKVDFSQVTAEKVDQDDRLVYKSEIGIKLTLYLE